MQEVIISLSHSSATLEDLGKTLAGGTRKAGRRNSDLQLQLCSSLSLSSFSFYGINLFLPFICSKFLHLAFVCVLSWLQVMPIVLHWCLFNSFQMLCYIYWLNVNVDICSSFYAKRRFYRSQCKTQANASWNSRLNKFFQCHREWEDLWGYH